MYQCSCEILQRKHKKIYSNSMLKVLPGSNLRSMSAADQKMIDDAIELVNQIAHSSLQNATTPKESDEKPSTPGRSKLKFSFKVPGKRSPRTEKKSFTEDLNTQPTVPLVSPEVEEAYSILVEKKPLKSSQRTRHSSEEEMGPQPALIARRKPPNPQANRNHRLSSSSIDRPKDRPPLPPPHHDVHDLSDIPATSPPPVPTVAGSTQTFSKSQVIQPNQRNEPVYNNMDVHWRDREENEALTQMKGRYKSGSDNVSYEDLLELSEQREKIRQLQLATGQQVSDADCIQALEQADGSITSAVKFIRLKQLTDTSLASADICKQTLISHNWDIKSAADHLLLKQNADLVGV